MPNYDGGGRKVMKRVYPPKNKKSVKHKNDEMVRDCLRRAGIKPWSPRG